MDAFMNVTERSKEEWFYEGRKTVPAVRQPIEGKLRQAFLLQPVKSAQPDQAGQRLLLWQLFMRK
ncbi:hypothetical protein C1N53_02740 [Pontibacter sp. SGAir0037]|nr:hypothetical protein C1N53_02740 [Pontibacter sp. SGAir0037]